MSPNRTPIATALLHQLATIAERWPVSKVRRLRIPQRPVEPGEHDAEFCAIELEDGAFGLSYILLGDTLDRMLARHGSRRSEAFGGADPMVLAQRLADGDAVERAVALAAINALTDSVWRRIGYTPPPAGNSLGDVVLGPQDHLGMIGFFPPLVRRVDEAGGRLTVVEMNAEMVTRQQERFPNVHVTLDRLALADCNTVVGTSTMLLNDSLDLMLAAAPKAQRFAVIGPSAGLWPDALFERGVTLLGGTQVVDGASFTDAMAAGESWTFASRKFAIARESWLGWRSLTSWA
jgi:uncharacterized protein